MIFREFNNIDIHSAFGVAGIRENTKHIARAAAKRVTDGRTRVLDVGTGTGFIAVYLATLGAACDGTDINPRALRCAAENARRNNVVVRFYPSDLFEAVEGPFDVITFNPPLGSAKSARLNTWLEMAKSLFPEHGPGVFKPTLAVFARRREKLMQRFLSDCRGVLSPGGSIVSFVYPSEVALAQAAGYAIAVDEEVLGHHLLVLSES